MKTSWVGMNILVSFIVSGGQTVFNSPVDFDSSTLENSLNSSVLSLFSASQLEMSP